MPIYCFTSEDGETIEQHFRAGLAPDRVVQGDVTYHRDIPAEHRGFLPSHAGWPLKSDAAGCHPDQRQEFHEDSVRRGVPTEFDRLGRAIFTNRSHRRAYLKARGIYDKDGGYGDG